MRRLALLTALACAGCGGVATTSQEQPTSAEINTEVFSKFTVNLSLSEWEETAGVSAGPKFNKGIRVTTTPVDKDLEVFVDGAAAPLVGSAGLPQQFDYQSYPEPASHEMVAIEFRYKGATFLLLMAPLEGEIQSPAQGGSIKASDEVKVTWQGPGPQKAEIETRHTSDKGVGGCTIAYGPAAVSPGHASFSPQPGKPGGGPPCTGDAIVSWTAEEKPQGTPFAGVTVWRSLRRVRSFLIE